MNHGPKIFRLRSGVLFGGCGERQLVLMVRDWLNGQGEKPALKDDADFTGVLITPHETVIRRIDPACYPYEVLGMPYLALGSGAEYALAAMACGKTAQEAVAIAARFDVYTGGHIDVLVLKPE